MGFRTIFKAVTGVYFAHTIPGRIIGLLRGRSWRDVKTMAASAKVKFKDESGWKSPARIGIETTDQVAAHAKKVATMLAWDLAIKGIGCLAIAVVVLIALGLFANWLRPRSSAADPPSITSPGSP